MFLRLHFRHSSQILARSRVGIPTEDEISTISEFKLEFDQTREPGYPGTRQRTCAVFTRWGKSDGVGQRKRFRERTWPIATRCPQRFGAFRCEEWVTFRWCAGRTGGRTLLGPSQPRLKVKQKSQCNSRSDSVRQVFVGAQVVAGACVGGAGKPETRRECVRC